MQEVLRCVSPTCQTLVTSTQTDIVAVHTPQTEVANTIEDGEVVCRLVHTQSRPSSLALGPAQQAAPQQQQVPQLSSYADSLVDGVIKDTVPMSVPEES